MGVYLVALTVGVPCALFLLYCLTPKGKHWLRVNGMLCPSYLSIYQFIYFSRLSGSRYVTAKIDEQKTDETKAKIQAIVNNL